VINQIEPFSHPILVTKPLLPDLQDLNRMLQEIWNSGWVTNGGVKHFKAGHDTKHYQLETKLQEYLKVPGFSLFNNGTTALMVGIKQYLLQGEVITTPFTFAATPHSLVWNNITPVFCDIDNTTLTIDPNEVEKLITEKTTGILGVHVFGMPCHVDSLMAIAKKYKLRVLFDAAHAFGTEIDGTGIGTYGDITMFSFHATKLFNTIEGGGLTYNSPEMKDEIELLKDFGIQSEEKVTSQGLNGKLNEIQAAIGLLNLEIIDDERKKRALIREIYTENLNKIKGINVFSVPNNVRDSYQYFVVRITKDFGFSRDKVYDFLRKYNIQTRKYFYPLCSDFDCYKDTSAVRNKYPVAEKAAKEVLCLPFHGQLQLDEVSKICNLIKEMKYVR